MLTKDHLCFECEKLNEEGMCGVYGWGGMSYRTRMGYCPIVEKYADWRDDKPKEIKKKVTKKKVKKVIKKENKEIKEDKKEIKSDSKLNLYSKFKNIKEIE